MPDNKERKNGDADKEPLSPRETTMRSIASSLAVMSLEKQVRDGGEIEFPSLKLKITKEDLVGSKLKENDKDKPSDT